MSTMSPRLTCKRTSETDGRQGSEEQVVEQNERVLIQVGCVEAKDICQQIRHRICDTKAYLFQNTYQNMAQVHMMFCNNLSTIEYS